MLHFSTVNYVHMVGVCGVGMAGVARLLAARGLSVSGCDSHLNELTNALTSSGVVVQRGHSSSHVLDLPDGGILVVTSAVSKDEPELVAAFERGIPVLRRGEVLAYLVSQSKGIAVCGTHGKTSTACFTTRLLQELGAYPGWCIGGFTVTLGSVAAPGDNSILVVEADESDGTLRHYHPSITVVNNIDIDHLEHFDSEEDLIECFRDVVRQTRDALCVCRDDERAWRVAGECGTELLDYGMTAEATLSAVRVETGAHCSAFNLIYKGLDFGRIELQVGGRHNIINALGAMAAAITAGYPVEDAVLALPAACSQLPCRRFEEIGIRNGARFIADYAHHPAEIKAAVEMALACRRKRVIAVFQPHRYTRTLALGEQFPAAFKGVDEVVLLPVYAASEALIEGGDICDLYAHFRKDPDCCRTTLCRSFDECRFYLDNITRSGDLVLIAGAGDVINLRDFVLEDMKEPASGSFIDELQELNCGVVSVNGSLDKFSIFPTQGCARVVVDCIEQDALFRVIALCDLHNVSWRPAGAGFNSWFSDCGCDKCIIRMATGSMKEILYEGGTVVAECSSSGPQLLNEIKSKGLSGLEFMEGIPGTLGGWLAMNAGAHGSCIADCVESLELIDAKGERITVPAAACGFGYRSCEALKYGFALSCKLRLKESTMEAVSGLCAQYSDKRIPLQGLRTAGSVFKNPPGLSAGKMLEEAGCKNLRIGGAYVTSFHANIIAVEELCSASDILALAMMMRNRVLFRCGEELEAEIKGLGIKNEKDCCFDGRNIQ